MIFESSFSYSKYLTNHSQFKIIILLVFGVIFFFIKQNEFWWIDCIALLIIILILSTSLKFVYKVKDDNNNNSLTIVYYTHFHRKKEKIIRYTDLSYKQEFLYSKKKNVLRISENKKECFKIIEDKDGWNKAIINELVKHLKQISSA